MVHHALSILCALSAATFATAGRERLWAPSAVVGFVVATQWFHPEPVRTGVAIALVSACLLIFHGRCVAVWGVAAGVAAGSWFGLLRDQGVHTLVAGGLASGVPLTSAWMAAKRQSFAPPILREQAMLIICGFSVIVAASPLIASGWQSAAVLNLQPGAGTRRVLEPWVMVLTFLSAAFGGVHALWRRR